MTFHMATPSPRKRFVFNVAAVARGMVWLLPTPFRSLGPLAAFSKSCQCIRLGKGVEFNTDR